MATLETSDPVMEYSLEEGAKMNDSSNSSRNKYFPRERQQRNVSAVEGHFKAESKESVRSKTWQTSSEKFDAATIVEENETRHNDHHPPFSPMDQNSVHRRLHSYPVHKGSKLPPKTPRPTYHRQQSKDDSVLEKSNSHCKTLSNGIETVLCPTDVELHRLNFILQKRTTNFGSNHPKVALAWNNIGNFHFKHGNLSVAMASYRQALQSYELSLGKEHQFVASTLTNIGNVFWSLGQHDMSLEYMELSHNILYNIYGGDHLETAKSLHNIGQVLCLRGDNDKAMLVLNESLSIRRANLGRNHIEVARSLSLMASVQLQNGKYEESLKLYEEALRMKRSLVGTRHPSVVISMVGMANVHKLGGKYDEAISLYMEALRLQRVLSSPEEGAVIDHQDVGVTLHSMGNCYAMMGEIEVAKKVLNEAFLIYRQVGIDHESRCIKALRRSIVEVNNML